MVKTYYLSMEVKSLNLHIWVQSQSNKLERALDYKEKIKIGQMFMVCHLKPWQSW